MRGRSSVRRPNSRAYASREKPCNSNRKYPCTMDDVNRNRAKVILSTITLTIIFCQRVSRAHKQTSFDEEIISRKSFVDKSELLAEFFGKDVGRDFFICPALFGKTTNLKMIEKFAQYQWNVNGDPIAWKETYAYQLFKRLKVAKHHKDVMRRHLAQHPVIYLDMNMENAGIGVFERLLSRMNSQLSHCFLEHQHRFEAYYKSADERARWSNVKDWALNAVTAAGLGVDTLSKKELVANLKYTIEAMNECFDANVVLLVDGFDDFMYRNSEPIEKMYTLYRVMEAMLRNVFESPVAANVHVFVSSATSLVFDHFQMYRYMQLHRFLEGGSKYSSYFGFSRDELEMIFDRYESNVTERQHVLRYQDGYQIDGRAQYSAYSISEFYHKRTFSKPRVPYKGFGRPKNPCKFIWKFLKNPTYLTAVAKMLKHCAVKNTLKKRYDRGAFTLYIDYVSRDFNSSTAIESATTHSPIGCSKATNLLFTLSIEHGIFAPPTAAENSYAVANYLMYTLLIRHLRLHYRLFHGIDIVQIGTCMNRVLHQQHRRDNDDESVAKFHLQTSLFQAIVEMKLGQNEDDVAIEFICHSLLHAAVYTNESLYIVEDYPTPLSYHDVSERNMATRCVSLIRSRTTDTALLIKITHRKSAEIALKQASSYVCHEPGVNTVKYVGIDVAARGDVNILIGYKEHSELGGVPIMRKISNRVAMMGGGR